MLPNLSLCKQNAFQPHNASVGYFPELWHLLGTDVHEQIMSNFSSLEPLLRLLEGMMLAMSDILSQDPPCRLRSVYAVYTAAYNHIVARHPRILKLLSDFDRNTKLLMNDFVELQHDPRPDGEHLTILNNLIGACKFVIDYLPMLRRHLTKSLGTLVDEWYYDGAADTFKGRIDRLCAIEKKYATPVMNWIRDRSESGHVHDGRMSYVVWRALRMLDPNCCEPSKALDDWLEAVYATYSEQHARCKTSYVVYTHTVPTHNALVTNFMCYCHTLYEKDKKEASDCKRAMTSRVRNAVQHARRRFEQRRSAVHAVELRARPAAHLSRAPG